MRPIRESTRADELYGPFMWGEVDLYDRFVAIGEQVHEIVPTCVGMSVSLREHGITLTLVASDEQISRLDAVQYVDGGPCVDALETGDVVADDERGTREDRGALFARASRRHDVSSTLSLPVPWERAGELGFNLYASASRAFDGLHEQLASLLGAWAGGAVTDADLRFDTRDLARQAPAVLQEAVDLAVVAGLLARARGLSAEDAAERLRQAATRAAVPLPYLLDLLRDVLSDDAP